MTCNSDNSIINSGVGNTILPPKKFRSWCFTINNHTVEIWNSLTHLKDEYKIIKIIFQEEEGKNNTPHLQGVIQFKNQILFSTLKDLFPTAHWEPCRTLKGSIKYCSKEETRAGNLFSYGIEKEELFIKKIKYTDKQLWNYTKDQRNYDLDNCGVTFEVYHDIMNRLRAESS